MTSKSVELKLYIHQNSETLVESFPAKDWGDFLVVGLKAENVDPTNYNQMVEMFSEYSRKTDKEVILVPTDWDIQFYGVEVYADEEESH